MKSFTLELSKIAGEWEDIDNDALHFCADGVDEYFEVPKEAKTIWMHFNDKAPDEDFYTCFLEGYEDIRILLPESGSWDLKVLWLETWGALNRLIPKGETFYLSVSYE